MIDRIIRYEIIFALFVTKQHCQEQRKKSFFIELFHQSSIDANVTDSDGKYATNSIYFGQFFSIILDPELKPFDLRKRDNVGRKAAMVTPNQGRSHTKIKRRGEGKFQNREIILKS